MIDTLLEIAQAFFTHPAVDAVGTVLVYGVTMYGVKKIMGLNPKQREQVNNVATILGSVSEIAKKASKQEEDICYVKEKEELNEKMTKATAEAIQDLGDMFMTFANSTKIDTMEKLKVAKYYEALKEHLKEVDVVGQIVNAEEAIAQKIDEVKEETVSKTSSYVNALKQLSETDNDESA